MERIGDWKCWDLNGAPMSHSFHQKLWVQDYKSKGSGRLQWYRVFQTTGQSYTQTHHKYYTCTCSQHQVDFAGFKKKYMILKVNRVGVVKGGIRGQDMGVDVIKLYCMHVWNSQTITRENIQKWTSINISICLQCLSSPSGRKAYRWHMEPTIADGSMVWAALFQ